MESGLPIEEVERRLLIAARLDRESRSAVAFFTALRDGKPLDASTFGDLPEDAREILEDLRAKLAQRYGREISDEELPALLQEQSAEQ
jgi:hypothetical protein